MRDSISKISVKPARGFSIVELMITILVAAVLMALALPSFRELSTRSNVTEITNQVVYALNTARSEAVRRGTQVEVQSALLTSKWSGGWTILADSNFDSVFTVGTDATIVTQGAVASTYSVCGRISNGGTGSSDSALVFGPSGALVGNPNTTFDINVNRPDGKAAMSQRISVQSSGEVRTQTGTASSPAPTSC
jgi:type IV fimbrial biogenesis protein FimT